MISNKHPFLLQSQHVSEICECLVPFGIHHFTYLKQYKNGERVSLSNKPEWVADYYNLKLYQSSLFEYPFKGPIMTFNTWFGDYDLEVYFHGRDKYNTMHAISITQATNHSYEHFLFSTTPDNPEAIHYLSNNREILFHFILFFKDRGKRILQLAEKSPILLDQPMINPSKVYNDEIWLQKMEKYKKDFFVNTNLSQVTLDTDREAKISKREIECISHILNYKSSSEIAEAMNISPRTVETYLQNIKNKLHCNTRSDLIKIFKNLLYWPEIL